MAAAPRVAAARRSGAQPAQRRLDMPLGMDYGRAA